MQKELNPELFGETHAKSRVMEQAPTNQMSVLEHKVLETRAQVQQMSDNLAKIVGQINEFIRGSTSKFERLNQAVQRLEQNDQALNLEAAQKINQIHNRLGERKTMDLKIQEMIDRHNSVLRSFEVRLAQMQKMMTEKEAQLVAAQSALNETKMEIARLKRF
jgi:chromosome segregation ATPase